MLGDFEAIDKILCMASIFNLDGAKTWKMKIGTRVWEQDSKTCFEIWVDCWWTCCRNCLFDDFLSPFS
jgi:hypothetical protein